MPDSPAGHPATAFVAPAVALLLVAAPATAGEVRFRDATAGSGIDFVHHDGPPVPPLFDGQNTRFGVGPAILDYDRDGHPDVFLPDSMGWPDRLWRNRGDGTFEEVTAEAGVAGSGMGHMALAVDLDGDGFDDLVVVNDASLLDPSFPTSRLWRNRGDGTFEDVTEGSGVAPHDPTFGGATAGDYDHDGDLDLFLVGWYDHTVHLYCNDGAFRFTDVTTEAGATPPDERFQWTPLFVDVDGDRLQDLFVAVDFDEDYLLANRGDGTFVDVSAEAGTLHEYNDMGVAAFDLQDDLDVDLYTTNVTGPEECDVGAGCNALYVNDGRGRFRQLGAESGLGDTAWGWGVAAFDAELDGDRDVLAVNGWEQPQWHTPASLFLDVGGRFVPAPSAAGIAHVGDTRSLVVFDRDGDGDLDALLTDVLGPARLYENVSRRDGGRWLAVAAEGTLSNRGGVGARVYVRAGGRWRMQEIVAGGSFYASPPKEAHFGLGAVESVDEVVVVFPSGRVARESGVEPDRRVVLVEPGGAE